MAITRIPDFAFNHIDQVDKLVDAPATNKTKLDSRAKNIRDSINNTILPEIETQLSNKTETTTFDAHLDEIAHELIIATRDLTLTGIQTISGLVGLPKSIKVIAGISGTQKMSIGLYAQTGGQSVLGSYLYSGDLYFNPTAGRVVVIGDSPIDFTRATIQNVQSGSFEVNWSKAGVGATGTATLHIICSYHGGGA